MTTIIPIHCHRDPKAELIRYAIGLLKTVAGISAMCWVGMREKKSIKRREKELREYE